MNTLQLKRALECDTFTKKIFGGVFAADELRKVMMHFPVDLLQIRTLVRNRERLGGILLSLT